MSWFFVGLDLGQSRDFTAIAVAERVEEKGAWDPALFGCRGESKSQLHDVTNIPNTPLADPRGSVSSGEGDERVVYASTISM